MELGLGRVKKSKNELKLNKFSSTQQTKSSSGRNGRKREDDGPDHHPRAPRGTQRVHEGLPLPLVEGLQAQAPADRARRLVRAGGGGARARGARRGHMQVAQTATQIGRASCRERV